jgi:cytoskeleton protein RodZ
MTETAVHPDPSDAPAARLGAELTAARRRLGWELPQLATSLRIRQSYLEAIETGRISELPGTTYALGFVRAYASALGLSGEDIARRFRAEAEGVKGQPELRFPAPVPRRGVPAGALMLLGLVILGGAYGGWYWVSEHRATPVETVPPIPDRLSAGAPKSTPSPAVASLLPATAPPAAQPPAAQPPAAQPPAAQPPAAAQPQPSPKVAVPTGAPTGSAPTQANLPTLVPGTAPASNTAPPTQNPGATPAPPPVEPAAQNAPAPVATAAPGIVVKATADAWITVKQPVGPPVLNKLMHAGDSWTMPADAKGLTLTTGNAGGTAIEVDGTPIPQPLGVSGAVRRDVPLDADMLKTGKLPPPKPRGKAKPVEAAQPE